MKQFISWLLTICLLLTLSACKETEVIKRPVVLSEGNVKYEKADQPLTTETIKAIPIAKSSMTSRELRQICVDYIKLSVSCQWVSDATYCIDDNDKKNIEKNFTEGKLYGGIPYINMASGNLYRFMEFYDTKTGILNSKALQMEPMLFATACSGTAGWAWARVINSAEISWTHSINVKHGFVPVGSYVYDFDMDQIWEWGKDGKRIYHYDTKKICKQNGEQVMYESYAQTLLADCYSRTGHVAMAASDPVVVRDKNGKIDGKKSYIDLAEQGQYTKAKFHLRKTSDGTEYRIRGNDGSPFTFEKLYEAGYLVHTFKEFLGTDPVEDAKATIEHTKNKISAKKLSKCTIKANYPISDIFTTIRDKKGNVLDEYIGRTADHFTTSVSGKEFLPIESIREHQGLGTNTIEIKAQLSTGDIVTVYEGTLKFLS